MIALDGFDDLGAVDPLEVDPGDAEIGVSEALDHDERDAFVGHLDGVGMPELMWREATPNSSCRGGMT